MIQHGSPPFLECSSHGDKRFSAFYARVRAYGGRTIEDVYQAAKIFDDGTTGLNWRQAKGRAAVNTAECAALYAELWNTYIAENPHLLPVLTAASGLSDKFGQKGRQCQATELWRIRESELLRTRQQDLPLTQNTRSQKFAAFRNRYAEACRQYFRDNPQQLERLIQAKSLDEIPALEGSDVRPSPLLWDIRNEELERRKAASSVPNQPRPTFTRARSSPEQQQDNDHEMD